jgi:hypothetical protein
MTAPMQLSPTSPFAYKDNILCVRADVLVKERSASGIVSQSLWDKWSRTGNLLQKGGNGRNSLIEFASLPAKWQHNIIARFGAPTASRNPLEDHFTMDAAARTFFDNYQLPTGNYLEAKYRVVYTVNASVLAAAKSLFTQREAMHRRMGGSVRGVWSSVVADVHHFNDYLLRNYQVKHDLPTNERRLREKMNEFHKLGYAALISEKFGNSNAQKVTDLMVKLWNDMFATQRHKPTYLEIAHRYDQFLQGKIEIVNSETGEVYNPNNELFAPISEASVYNYLQQWENRIINERLRTDDNQKYKSKYVPYHKLMAPNFSGSMISVDDRQPPFESTSGKRVWFYNGIDLHSQAFIAWTYGDTKEGIILEFYRQLVRNIAEWGFNMPAELEAEMSLNSSYMGTFLTPGVMFSAVRIEANNARGKRIERFYRDLRYNIEKKREGWLARPFAISESNQARVAKKVQIPADIIIDNAHEDIETWNNTLHPDQNKYPGMTRWEVWITNQHPDLKPINWYGILPFIGHRTPTSVNAGRAKLQYRERVLGLNGCVATGDTLIQILKKVEGKTLDCYWLDDNDGNVLKAVLVHNGAIVCELLGDLKYNRSSLERTAADDDNRALMSRYQATVDGFIKTGRHSIERVEIFEVAAEEKPKTFTIRKPGARNQEPGTKSQDERQSSMVIPEPIEPPGYNTPSSGRQAYSTSTASRF